MRRRLLKWRVVLTEATDACRKFLFKLDDSILVSLLPTTAFSWKMNEKTKVGIGLLGCGAFFAFLGIVLFFDKGLLALSNIFCFSGVVLLLGWQSAWQLLMNKKNYKGSICFILGIFSILLRWPIVGFILEIYGTYVLFRGFLPSAKEFINHMPGVGSLLHYQFQLLDYFRQKIG